VSPKSDHTTVTRPLAGAWCTDGERFLDEALDRLPGFDVDGPSLLPGWSRRTVIAHVARNADALCNLLTWARTGVETPMYASSEARDKAIATTAQLPLASLMEDCRSASRRFAADVNGLPETAWDVDIRTAQGRTVPVSQAVWMRCREVWVHAVDLRTGKGFDDIADDVLVALIDDVTGMWARRGQTPEVRFSASDRHWGTGKVVVTADLADLAGYVTGRRRDAGDDRPTLPPWL
jgi:maleylpyruvate isomerase